MLELPPFTIQAANFQGTLSEALHALRREKFAPEAINLLQVVQDYLEYYHQYAPANLEATSQILPQLAAIIELKTRLLLPRPPKTSDAQEEEVIEILQNLEQLDHAIDFLRQQQQARQHIVPAQLKFTPPQQPPDKPRKLRRTPKVQKLLEFASRYQSVNYFELSRERISLPMALKAMRQALQHVRRSLFRELHPANWADTVVYFSALLEMVKTGQVQAEQLEPFDDINLHYSDARAQQNRRSNR